MDNVGAHHYLGRIVVAKQEQHHDNAAGADRRNPHEEPRAQTNSPDPGDRFHTRDTVRDLVLNASLEKQERGDDHEQEPDSRLDEIVYSSTVKNTKMSQEGHAGDGSGDTARCERQDYSATDCTLAQVQQDGRDLGEEVDERV